MLTAHFTGTQGTPDSVTSYFMGGQFEIKDSAVKKYYSIAGMMVAVNDGTGLQYLLTDHLSSTVAVVNSSGTLTSQQRYLPFGGTRAIPNSPILGTDFTYTGQRKLDDGMGGIMDYRARFYSPALMRFLQPDSITPGADNPQNWNRFAYARNNPILYNDPTGHCIDGISTILCIMVISAVVNVAVDAFVTKVVLKEDYTWKDAAVTAGISIVTAGVGGGLVAVAGKALAKTALSVGAKFIAKTAAETAINIGMGFVEREIRGQETTGENIAYDAIGGYVGSLIGTTKVDDVADYAGQLLDQIPLNHKVPPLIANIINESIEDNRGWNRLVHVLEKAAPVVVGQLPRTIRRNESKALME